MILTLFEDNFLALRDSPLPSVTTLVYAIQSACCGKEASRLLNLRVQHALLVRRAVVPFPNVTCFRVGETVEWVRADAKSQDWRPRLVSRSLVRELLLRQWRPVRNIDDVDGVIRSALWEKDWTPELRARLGYAFRGW